MKIDHAVAVDRQFRDRVGRKTTAAAHRRVLDRRHKQSISQGLTARDLDRRRQRQHVGFGGTTGEGDVLGLAADQGSNLFARFFHQPAGGTPFAMHR